MAEPEPEPRDERRVARRSVEVRVARDGCAYTLAEFKSWYPEIWSHRWDRAIPMPLTGVPPEGLAMATVSEVLVREALAEILPRFPSAGSRAGTQQRSLEIGFAFYHDRYTRDRRANMFEVDPLNLFPRLRSLLSGAMRALRGNDELAEARLNVSCLFYSPGQGIRLHRDRTYCYAEEVFGCIRTLRTARSSSTSRPGGII